MTPDVIERVITALVEAKDYWQSMTNWALESGETWKKRAQELELENAALLASVNAKTNGADA